MTVLVGLQITEVRVENTMNGIHVKVTKVDKIGILYYHGDYDDDDYDAF